MARSVVGFDPSHEYAVEARRSGGWWALRVPEVPGVHSQVRRLDQASGMARDALALAFDVEPEDVRVAPAVPVLSPELDELLRATLRQRDQLAGLRASVDAQTRQLAQEWATAGIPVRDIAVALDVSFQYAAKLARRAS